VLQRTPHSWAWLCWMGHHLKQNMEHSVIPLLNHCTNSNVRSYVNENCTRTILPWILMSVWIDRTILQTFYILCMKWTYCICQNISRTIKIIWSWNERNTLCSYNYCLLSTLFHASLIIACKLQWTLILPPLNSSTPSLLHHYEYFIGYFKKENYAYNEAPDWFKVFMQQNQ
jgi:hypothetical protein